MKDYWTLPKAERKALDLRIATLRKSISQHQGSLQYHTNMVKHETEAVAIRQQELNRLYIANGITCPGP